MNAEGATQEEIKEALLHLSASAKKCQYVIGTEKYPSKWDEAHKRIDTLLNRLERGDVH